MKMLKFGFLLLLCVGISVSVNAQAKKKKKKAKSVVTTTTTTTEQETTAASTAAPTARRVTNDSIDYDPKTGYNYLSVQPIHTSDIMYRMRVWRNIDFNEKCNLPFFNGDGEITKFLMEAHKAGEILAFTNDSLVEEKPATKIKDNMEELDNNDHNNDKFFVPKNLTTMEIKEDLIFDKQRSQTKFDILAVTLWLPASFSIRGQDIHIASFRYKDVERVLDSRPAARWKNGYNNAEDRRFSDAFRLRLFCSRIFKISKDNPTNNMISAIPALSGGGSPRSELLSAQQFEYDLVSQENELYEY